MWLKFYRALRMAWSKMNGTLLLWVTVQTLYGRQKQRTGLVAFFSVLLDPFCSIHIKCRTLIGLACALN